ncbi:MAG TPA: protein kinase [Candidatus Sulfotelmatobacter sp.]|jgi:hypothetical protein|nr:protein kinase [Candidatus Sulfotelmatobacter sp.]
MNADSLLSSAGWGLEVATFSKPAAEGGGADFHAVYRGESFGNPSRGVAAVVARANGQGRAAVEAVQVAVHQFAEGLFSLPATLGSGRAAERSLSAVNDWLFSQARGADLSLSLSAVLFSNRRVGIVHVGNCLVYRARRGEVVRLTSSHLRRFGDGHEFAARAVGAERDLRVDYIDLAVEAGDRFLLLSAAPVKNLENLAGPLESLAAGLFEGQEAPASLVLIEVGELPEASYDDLAAEFSALPLRPPPKDGDIWDGFVISHTLYRSRWTVLKVARDTVDGGEVVLKIPLPAMLHDKMFKAGFLREAWVGRLTSSPWVSRPIELPPERRTSLYLVMPYYRGEGLAKRIVRKPKLTVIESVDIILKLCAAVQGLLNQQIVHRDIKPENVLISANGGVTLLDLGMAYLPAIDGPLDEGIGGSTHYMAPELFNGAAAGARTEVFALAATLYRMVCGDYPFTGRDATPPPAIPGHLPRWLGKALLQALSPQPEARPASPADFARLLEEGLVRGDPAPLRGRRLWRKPSQLDLWRGAALIFAAAFAVLLARDLVLPR